MTLLQHQRHDLSFFIIASSSFLQQPSAASHWAAPPNAVGYADW
jgi:hypothetical protein